MERRWAAEKKEQGPAAEKRKQPDQGAEEKTGRFGLVDILKGLAIIGVVLLHAFEWPQPLLAFLQLSVPLFILLMGFNFALSLKRGSGLKSYFLRRAKRLLPAFAAAWVAVVALALLLNVPMRFGGQQLIGFFPVVGAGNYFIPLVFEFVLFAPLMFAAYRKSKAGSLALFVALWLSFLTIQFAWFTYSYNLLRFLPIVWLGFFLSEKGLLKRNIVLQPLNWLGRHSYEIFLLQIVFFSAIGQAIIALI
jgi:peptidoglycan/LPS O-acetylase OafA/YrhL